MQRLQEAHLGARIDHRTLEAQGLTAKTHTAHSRAPRSKWSGMGFEAPLAERIREETPGPGRFAATAIGAAGRRG